MDSVVDVNPPKNGVGNDIGVPDEEEGTTIPNQRSDGEKEVPEKYVSTPSFPLCFASGISSRVVQKRQYCFSKFASRHSS